MFSQRLKKLRVDHSLSQKELAQRLQFSQQAVTKWENDVASPDPDTLRKIAIMFHVSVDYLIGNDIVSEDSADYMSAEELVNRLLAKPAIQHYCGYQLNENSVALEELSKDFLAMLKIMSKKIG